MSQLLQTIQRQLDKGLDHDLRPLFLETLQWGMSREGPLSVRVGSPVNRRLHAVPVAQLSGIPVYRIDWPDDRLPKLTERRAVHRSLQKHAIEHLLCYVTSDKRQAAFVWARRRKDGRIELRMLPYERGGPARTTIEQLGNLRFEISELGPTGEPPLQAVLDKLNSAFDVQAVTRRFFDEYEEVFDRVRRELNKRVFHRRKDAHDFTQLLFNRLMFCWFLQKKGWLGGRRDYLLTLLNRATHQNRNAYLDYFAFLFFEVLSNPEEQRRKPKRGDPHVAWEAPFLNGGLFERTKLDERVEQLHRPARPAVPNSVLTWILRDLFARYNFTVEESTPLDVQVALDPELLGTIFERLVTGRHETGSYYTPREIVEFMCREALVVYLSDALPDCSAEVIERLVYEHDVSQLSPAYAPALIQALDNVRICDPACGSGAYLVAMLHELVNVYRTLYSEALKDPKKDYELKLRIIQRNLYGVDIDPFAVNIARLRLWLSLVVDNPEEDWRKVEPLPNLDFKIEVGDSLTAPNPRAGMDIFLHAVVKQADQLAKLKGEYLTAHGQAKQRLRKQIEEQERQLSEVLKQHEATSTPVPRGAIDWRVRFAEVFWPRQTHVAQDMRQLGGFDIVITNPPWVRQEIIDRQFGEGYKAGLVELYPDACTTTSDLSVAFLPAPASSYDQEE